MQERDGQSRQETPAPVGRRLALYVPGFDPAGGGRYARIYRSEAARWSALFDGRISVSGSRRDGSVRRWEVSAEIAGAAVHTDYRVLDWRDLAIERMRAPLWKRLLRGIAMYLAITLDGTLSRMLALAWLPAIVTLYPFAFALGFAAACLAAALLPPLALGALTGGSAWWFAPFGAALGWAALRWTGSVDRTSYTYYLLDSYSLMRDYARGNARTLRARIRDGAALLAREAGAGEWDEILVIGHSSGSSLALSMVAEALALEPDLPRLGPAIGVLTLGQNLSAQAMFAGGEAHAAEFRRVAATEGLSWVDVSSRADGVCYALCDPLAARTPAPPPEERRAGPKVISAKFHETIAPERFATFARNHFERHFQYLHAFERPQEYDFFRITAGPLTLRERFRNVASNPRTPPTAWEPAPIAAERAAPEQLHEPAA
ncbi:MAG: hypothetical protein AAFW46_03115 [Pseudomonadota bacterium]